MLINYIAAGLGFAVAGFSVIIGLYWIALANFGLALLNLLSAGLSNDR